MGIERFVNQSIGEWRSMRSGHSLAFQQFEQVLSYIKIKPLSKNDPNVLNIIEADKSLNGEIIVMNNSYLTNGIISNYSEMKKRRIVHKLGVIYDTKHKIMEKIPILIREIVEKVKDAEFDRCHFIGFGESSLDLELVYYVPTNDYLRAMNAQQQINLDIMSSFEENQIEFAFPTRTLHLNKNLAPLE